MFTHVPVMLNEVLEGLNIKSDGIYLDLTLGRAGHSSEILKKLTTGYLYGFDQDITAINESNARLAKISDRYKLIHTNFKNLKSVLEKENIKKVDGILMDLGVSSPQFDDGSRGFSYRVDAPLDMRMNQEQDLTAYDLVNKSSLDELCRIFREYGEEKYAFSIAKNILKRRENSPIKTTFELVEIIKASKPAKELAKAGHPAKQAFQALRIAVNDELGVLKIAIKDAIESLSPNGGRLAIITFHSLEDRIVKDTFKEYAVTVGNRIDGPNDIKEKEYSLVTNKPIVASNDELEVNHRSASAKLRIIERK